MSKEPIGLSLFRYLLILGILAFMGMLYWSSLVIEENLEEIHDELVRLKNDPTSYQKELDPDKAQNINGSKFSNQTSPLKNLSSLSRRHIDANFPNLLQEDPFYSETLP